MTLEIFSLEGKSALVTGAYGYLGQAMADGLARAGATVYLNGRNEEKVDALVNKLAADGCSVESAIFDVTKTSEIEDFIRAKNLKQLDILVHNAYSGAAGSVETADSENYRVSYEISVIAAHALVQAFLPCLRQASKLNGDASVINIASMYGMVSPDCRIYLSKEACNPPFYGAAKAALIQWTKYAACEFGKEGIRFNVISPGPFPSDKVKEENSELVKKIVQKVPMERVGLPSELIGPVVFLASRASVYINGANIVVDGGWTAW